MVLLKKTFIGDKTGGCFDDCILASGSWLRADGEGEKKLPRSRLVMRLAK